MYLADLVLGYALRPPRLVAGRFGSSPRWSLRGLLRLLYGIVAELQEQASHENQTEALAPRGMTA